MSGLVPRGALEMARNHPLGSQVIVALTMSIVGSLVLVYFREATPTNILLLVLCILLTVHLVLSQTHVGRLAYAVKSLADGAAAGSPKERLLGELVGAMRFSGYVSGEAREGVIRDRLSTSEYVRGQHVFRILRDGTPSCREKFLSVNDHPFTPFAELLGRVTPPGIEVVAINSVPDELYSQGDIKKRLDLAIAAAKDAKQNYYLVPNDLIRVAIIIFDDKAALVYTQPPGSEVCNFSEALRFTDEQAVAELEVFVRFLQRMAEDWARRNRFDALAHLKKRITFGADES